MQSWDASAGASSLPDQDRLRELLAPDCSVVEYRPLVDSVRCTIIGPGATSTLDIEVLRYTLEAIKLRAAFLEPGAINSARAAAIVEQLRADVGRYLLTPLVEAVESQGIRRIATVGLGHLARVPFHIATDDASAPFERRFDLAYLPSLDILAHLRRPEPTSRLTVLADPTENLPIVRALAIGLRQLGADVAVGSAVDRSAVIDQLRGDGHLLICCHASEHGLELSDGVLGAGAISDALDASRRTSVGLIACRAAHGFVTIGSAGAALPECLLRKGVGAVVAARWKVPELSAALFADSWTRALLRGATPMVAHRHATAALQRLTVDQLRMWLRQQVAVVREFDTGTTSPAWFETAVGLDLASLEPGGAETTSTDRARWQLAHELMSTHYGRLALLPVDQMKVPLYDIKDALAYLRDAPDTVGPSSPDVGINDQAVFRTPSDRFNFFLYGLPI